MCLAMNWDSLGAATNNQSRQPPITVTEYPRSGNVKERKFTLCRWVYLVHNPLRCCFGAGGLSGLHGRELAWSVTAGNPGAKQKGSAVPTSPSRASNFLISSHQASLPKGPVAAQKLPKY